MMKRITVTVVAGISAVLLLIIIIWLLYGGLPGTKSIRIGAVLPLTGNLAFLGDAIRNGMEMSKDQINSHGGIQGRKLEIIYEDSKGNAKDGLSGTQKLVDFDQVRFVLINLTNVCLAARPILDQKQVLAFYLSTHPAVLDGSPNGFRVFISGVQESILLSGYAREHGYKALMILNVNDAYGKGTAQYLKSMLEKFAVIRSVEEYNLPSPDFRVIVTKIRAASPNALVVIGYGQEYPLLFRQLEEQGWSGPVLGNISFANLAGQALQSPLVARVSYTAPGYISDESRHKSSQNFIGQYTQKYGKAPDFNAAYGYDNVKLLAQALSAVGDSNISRLRNHLVAVRGYEGAIGRIDLTSSGDSETDMRVVGGIVTPR